MRGKLTGLDLATGKIVWRAYHTGPDKDVLIGPDFNPFYQGSGARPGRQHLARPTSGRWAAARSGAGSPTIRNSNLIFYGTGNPGVWNRRSAAGDQQWSMYDLARAIRIPGRPNGLFRSCRTMTGITTRSWRTFWSTWTGAGHMRKLLLHPGRNGFMYRARPRNRRTAVRAKVLDSTNWADGFDLRPGSPTSNASETYAPGHKSRRIFVLLRPAAKNLFRLRFRRAPDCSIFPATTPAWITGALEASYIAGTPYLGASVKMKPGPGGYQGELVAWDVKNSQAALGASRMPRFPLYSGVLSHRRVTWCSTARWMAGSKPSMRSRAKFCGSYKTAPAIIGNPMTFHRAGRQAVCRGLFRRRRLDGRGGSSVGVERRSLRGAGRRGRDERHQELHRTGRRGCMSSVCRLALLAVLFGACQAAHCCVYAPTPTISRIRTYGSRVLKMRWLVWWPAIWVWPSATIRAPQRGRYLKNTLYAGKCDVIIGIATAARRGRHHESPITGPPMSSCPATTGI